MLRAVLFVQLIAAIAAMFWADTPLQWLFNVALLTGGALPGTLFWLILCCALKHPLQRLGTRGHYLAGIFFGAMAGIYACLMLSWVGVRPHWLASATTGALMASLVVKALMLRARATMPADTQARLVELQSRIRPHFLFNTLNSAIALIRAEPAKAETLLEDLSDLFRYALAEPHATATLAEEIELAKRYLAIEQVRFGERLQMQWLLDESAHHALLPPLLLQPLVENAIRHGIEPNTSGGKLQVRTERKGSQAVVQITNTLPAKALVGRPKTQGNGIALANVKERLALLHDFNGSISTGIHEGFFIVRLSVPLQPESNCPS